MKTGMFEEYVWSMFGVTRKDRLRNEKVRTRTSVVEGVGWSSKAESVAWREWRRTIGKNDNWVWCESCEIEWKVTN